MKKLILLTFIAFVSANLLQAQSEKSDKVRPDVKFRKGDIEFKAGIGLIPTFIGDQAETLFQPVQATLGYRVNPNFSLNAFAGYSSYIGKVQEFPNGSSYQTQNDMLVLGLRAEAHMTRIKNVDVYGGMMLAYSSPTITRKQLSAPSNVSISDAGNINPTPYNPNDDGSGVIIGGFIGGAYYLTPQVSVFGEIGYGTSIAVVGLGYKF